MAREDHDVPTRLRSEVTERDGSCCRVCGVYVRYPALHHIEYRSEGGRNEAENLIVIGWLPGHDCHLPVVHARKGLWQPILKIVVASEAGVTAFAVRRQLELAGLEQLDSDNARSRLQRRRLELPRVERPLAGWPSLRTEDTAHPLSERETPPAG